MMNWKYRAEIKILGLWIPTHIFSFRDRKKVEDYARESFGRRWRVKAYPVFKDNDDAGT